MTPSCKFRKSVRCERHKGCDSCGFNPIVEHERNNLLRRSIGVKEKEFRNV